MGDLTSSPVRQLLLLPPFKLPQPHPLRHHKPQQFPGAEEAEEEGIIVAEEIEEEEAEIAEPQTPIITLLQTKLKLKPDPNPTKRDQELPQMFRITRALSTGRRAGMQLTVQILLTVIGSASLLPVCQGIDKLASLKYIPPLYSTPSTEGTMVAFMNLKI